MLTRCLLVHSSVSATGKHLIGTAVPRLTRIPFDQVIASVASEPRVPGGNVKCGVPLQARNQDRLRHVITFTYMDGVVRLADNHVDRCRIPVGFDQAALDLQAMRSAVE